MKTLLLIRHAKSSWKNPDRADVDRPLNKRGKRDAPFMASVLKRGGIRPDRIVTSPARRARKTAKAFAGVLEFEGTIERNESIYEAGYEGLMEAIRETDRGCGVLFVFGHNPEITELAEDLSSNTFGNVPTCGIVCCVFNIQTWDEVLPGQGRFVFFEYPKKHAEEA